MSDHIQDVQRLYVLYRADGMPHRREVGFVRHGEKMAIQTTGQFPQLTTKPTKKTGKKRGR